MTDVGPSGPPKQPNAQQPNTQQPPVTATQPPASQPGLKGPPPLSNAPPPTGIPPITATQPPANTANGSGPPPLPNAAQHLGAPPSPATQPPAGPPGAVANPAKSTKLSLNLDTKAPVGYSVPIDAEIKGAPPQPAGPQSTTKLPDSESTSVKVRDAGRDLTVNASEYKPELGFNERTLTERDGDFRGKQGEKLRQLIQEKAQILDLNPGLLAAHILAEADSPKTYLRTTGTIDSYDRLGADNASDFFQKAKNGTYITNSKGNLVLKKEIAENIPASKDLRATLGDRHLNDAPYGKQSYVQDVKVPANQALLLSGVYLKNAEIKARNAVSNAGMNFDSASPEARFALTRIAVNPGRQSISTQVARLSSPEDILRSSGGQAQDRRHPQRGATRVAAQGIHLSQAVFGIAP